MSQDGRGAGWPEVLPRSPRPTQQVWELPPCSESERRHRPLTGQTRLHCRRRSALAWSAGVSQPSSATTADLAGVPGEAAAVTFPAAGCRSLPPEPARRRSRAAGRGGVPGGGSDGRCPSRPRAGGRPADSGQRILAEQTGGVLAWGGDKGPCRANAWLPRSSTASPAGEPHRPPCPLPRSPQQACSPTPAAAPPPALGTRRQAGACEAGHRARPGGPLQSRA